MSSGGNSPYVVKHRSVATGFPPVGSPLSQPTPTVPTASHEHSSPIDPDITNIAQNDTYVTEHNTITQKDGPSLPRYVDGENYMGETRPSSRRALTKALELAREAVKLDSTNDDPYATVLAYGRSVALLSEVMDRVRRGEDSTESRGKRRVGRRRSVVAQEEEVRRLQSIHDTYADRMNILSLIYSIPPLPHSPSFTSSASTSPVSDCYSSPQLRYDQHVEESKGSAASRSCVLPDSASAECEDTVMIPPHNRDASSRTSIQTSVPHISESSTAHTRDFSAIPPTHNSVATIGVQVARVQMMPSETRTTATHSVTPANEEVTTAYPGLADDRSRRVDPAPNSTLRPYSHESSEHTIQLINPSTTMSTIHQRRAKLSAPPSMTSTRSPSPTESRLHGPVSQPPTTINSGRGRASSQPGQRPSIIDDRVSAEDFSPRQSPLPTTRGVEAMHAPSRASLPLQTTFHSHMPQLIDSDLMPTPASALIPPLATPASSLPTTPTSSLPSMAPIDGQRKPYHLMNLLGNTMRSKSGGYLTRRLHIPQEVWSQGGAKLNNVAEKVRVVEVLCSALEEMHQYSIEYFGAGNVCSGFALGIGSVGRKEAEAWMGKLEEFSAVCDSIVSNFGKKLGVGEGFVVKKSTGVISWGGKLTRQFDKLTNAKNLDSPATYVVGLSKLFLRTQLLDEHTKALISQPIAPIYAAFPVEIRSATEFRLRRASEFFASVVLTFVIRDLSQLLDKYAKKCEKWLAE